MIKAKSLLWLVMIIALAACSTENGAMQTSGSSHQSPNLKVKNVSNVDVVDTHGGIEGLDKMQRFYDTVKKEGAADLRIVRYTIEGDPLVTDLSFNEKTLEVKHDYSRDAYGSGEITTQECRRMIEEVNPTNISYIAVDCSGLPFGMDQILHVDYNMGRQDLFEFELKYGKELENEISTIENEKIKQISADETEVTKDFDLPEYVMQEIYKQLVLANYLGEKDLKTSCGNEEALSYELMIHINGGNQVLEWATCDKGRDGTNMSAIAQYMIDQSEIGEREMVEYTVQGYVMEVKDRAVLVGEELNMFDYQMIKDGLPENGLDSYIFDFTWLEGVNPEDFKQGDKVQATLNGKVEGTSPRTAQVKEIKKIDLQE